MDELTAVNNVKNLGRTFREEMTRLGHEMKDDTELMDGLVAYHMLKLKGQNERLDKSVQIVTQITYDLAKERMN